MAEYTISKIKLPNNDVCNLKDETLQNATTSVAGLMSAADKAKLDGIGKLMPHGLTGTATDTASSDVAAGYKVAIGNLRTYTLRISITGQIPAMGTILSGFDNTYLQLGGILSFTMWDNDAGRLYNCILSGNLLQCTEALTGPKELRGTFTYIAR